VTKPKLLLADDSVTIRKVVELTFADEGIDVSTVADAEAAMQKFVEIQPQIVLVDVGLSGTNGYQICEMIKQDEATRHIPVMLLVGSFEPFDQDEAERVGADGFLTKPFHSIRDLVSRVWELLGRESTAVETEPIEVEEIPSPAVTPETADIESLYHSSLSETVEIEDFDTVEDLLGNAELDDQMIEAEHPENFLGDTIENLSTETIEQTKEFDWSPEAIITEPQKPAFEPKFVFDETPIDESPVDETHIDERSIDVSPVAETSEDETQIDESATDADVAENESQEPEFTSSAPVEVPPDDEIHDSEVPFDTLDTIEISHIPNLEDDGAETDELKPESEDEVDLLNDDGLDDPGVVVTQEIRESEIDPAIHETSPYTDGEVPVAENGTNADSPSPEMIEMIAQRVVQRLSDSVIREIAQVEVPKIAEKLIREALKEENKA